MADKKRSRIKITDLPKNAKVSEDELKRVSGGAFSLRNYDTTHFKVEINGIRANKFSERIYKF